MEYEIQAGDFQGPLDLLYKLVKKNQIEISEISLAKITEEYLYHIKKLNKFNLDQASEFMVLASELLEIKARLLLPNQDEEEEEDESDLVQRLEEYELFKNIAVELELYLDKASRTYRIPPEKELITGEENLAIDIPLAEFRNLCETAVKAQKKDEDKRDPHYSEMDHINSDRVKVEDKREDIHSIIQKRPEGVKFHELLYNQDDVLEIVVTLLSLLELVRLRKIEIYQDKLFSEMKIMDRKQVV